MGIIFSVCSTAIPRRGGGRCVCVCVCGNKSFTRKFINRFPNNETLSQLWPISLVEHCPFFEVCVCVPVWSVMNYARVARWKLLSIDRCFWTGNFLFRLMFSLGTRFHWDLHNCGENSVFTKNSLSNKVWLLQQMLADLNAISKFKNICCYIFRIPKRWQCAFCTKLAEISVLIVQDSTILFFEKGTTWI